MLPNDWSAVIADALCSFAGGAKEGARSGGAGNLRQVSR
jgi:hypothetical protein